MSLTKFQFLIIIRIEVTFKFENENLSQELKHQIDLELKENEENDVL